MSRLEAHEIGVAEPLDPPTVSRADELPPSDDLHPNAKAYFEAAAAP